MRFASQSSALCYVNDVWRLARLADDIKRKILKGVSVLQGVVLIRKLADGNRRVQQGLDCKIMQRCLGKACALAGMELQRASGHIQ